MLETLNPVKLRQQTRLMRTVNRVQLKLNLLAFENSYVRSLNRRHALDYVSGRLTRKFAELRRGLHSDASHQGKNQLARDKNNLPELLYTAAATYVPAPYDSPVAMVYSRKRLYGFGNDPTLGWDKSLFPNMQFIAAERNHYTMYIEPNVEGLAQSMAVQLKAAQEGWLKDRVLPGSLPAL